MTARAFPTQTPSRDPSPSAAKRALVLDDSRGQRALLASMLKRWGWDVTAEADPAAALKRLSVPGIGMVLCDWVMPGMSGPEFCRRLRAVESDDYPYVILLTSKSDKEEIAHGLDAGADDFLVKPVTSPELRARMAAGERLVAMQRELVQKNRIVSDAFGELQCLYDGLDRDLREARKLQTSLLGARVRRFDGATVSLALQPAGHVGGDLVGAVPLSAQRIAVFGLDVSGHGVASALMTAQVASLIGRDARDAGLLQAEDSASGPVETTSRLNAILTADAESDHYLTLALAEIDLVTGRLRLVQAGHPHPLLLRAGGRIERLGHGGLPVGMIEGAGWDSVGGRLRPGDRLLIHSDGVTECTDAGGRMLEQEGLVALLRGLGDLRGERLLDAVTATLADRRGGAAMEDDVSMALVEFRGA